MSHPRSPDSIPELDRDWNTFIGLDQMTNHWSRASWWPGRRAFYWYLTFDCNSELRSLTEHCQSAIEAPHFDLVPPNDLHMTIARIGFEDELGEDELDAVATAARRVGQRISSFDILIGPLAGSSGAISFSVAPLEPIQRVREVLLATSAEGRKNSKFKNDYFRPHVGIAYCNTTIPTSRIIPKIQPLRELPPVRAHVAGANLVLLTRGEQSYRWSTIGGCAFSAATQPGVARSSTMWPRVR